MTTIVANHYDNIPYTGFATFKITGPLSNHNFPNFVKGPIDNKIMVGYHMNPAQFSNPGAGFSQARSIFTRTDSTMQVGRNGGLQSQPDNVRSRPYPRHNAHAQVQNKKYIAPTSTSMYIYAKKNAVIGKSSIAPSADTLSYAGIDLNVVKSTIGRLRRHGCAAPRKSYAIENKFKGAGYWGAQARQGLFW